MLCINYRHHLSDYFIPTAATWIACPKYSFNSLTLRPFSLDGNHRVDTGHSIRRYSCRFYFLRRSRFVTVVNKWSIGWQISSAVAQNPGVSTRCRIHYMILSWLNSLDSYIPMHIISWKVISKIGYYQHSSNQSEITKTHRFRLFRCILHMETHLKWITISTSNVFIPHEIQLRFQRTVWWNTSYSKADILFLLSTWNFSHPCSPIL